MVPELHYFDEPLEGTPPVPRSASVRAGRDDWRSTTLARLQQLGHDPDLDAAAWWAIYSFVDRDDRWYRSLFAFAPPDCVAGEITPRYMLCGSDEIAHMHRVAPDAKLIFLLRHPVERFWSQCKMKHADGTLAPGESPAMHLFDTLNGRPRGEYSKAIVRFCREFDPAHMLVVFFESILRRPRDVLRDVYSFLRMETPPVESGIAETPVNRSASREPMPTGLRARVEAAYRQEIEILADVFGGHANEWLDPEAVESPAEATVRLTPSHVARLEHHHSKISCVRRQRGKIFCLSLQRSGTTSVGDWLESHGFARAGSPTSVRLGWTRLWLEGKHDAIFASREFQECEIFEDDPWWCTDFYRVVVERYPDAKFILMERDPDAWFESMCHHSAGRNPGWADVHARVYDREADLQTLLAHDHQLRPEAWGLLSLLGHRQHYLDQYKRHGERVRDYFRSQPHRLFYGRLDDPQAFIDMCSFVGIAHNPAIPVPRSNASTDAMRRALQQHLDEQTVTGVDTPIPPAHGGGHADAVTVFVTSWGRPLYLWACLDALFRLTRSGARFVLLDNAHPDPLVGEVIKGFWKRGMFEEVIRFDTNAFSNFTQAYQDRLSGIGNLHVYVESDCVIVDRPTCWLAEMRGIMERHPHIGFLGSVIDPVDFVDRDTALRLAGGDAKAAEFLAKLASPERALRTEPSWSSPDREFFVTDPPCPLPNPPGRLMMLRTPLMQELGFQLDGSLAVLVRQRGLLPAVTPRVRHRHLSLLNVFDYGDYDEQHRNSYFFGIPAAGADTA